MLGEPWQTAANRRPSFAFSSYEWLSQVKAKEDSTKSKLFFVHGCGGSGKAYLYKTLLAPIVRKDIKRLPSSSIAALLRDDGHTAHSMLKIPIKVNETSDCGINRGTADLIYKLIFFGMKHDEEMRI